MGGAKEPGARPAAAPSAFEWNVPEGWKQTTPASTMRIAQFDVPGTWPDGVPVVCALFGQIGGGRQANVDRWIGQFRQADGTPSKDRTKLTESKAGDLAVTRVELTGAFSDGMQKPPRQTDDGMLLGGIVEAPDGASIYVKLTGPRDVVAAQTAAFDAFLASFRPAKR
jgi:hypothetical protein